MSVPLESVELRRVFRRGFTTTLVMDLVTSAVGAVTVIILIRGLSVTAYAFTTLLLTFGQFAGSAASGGVRTRYLREEAERVSRGASAARPGAYGDALVRGTLAIVGLALIGAPAAALAGFGSEFSNSSEAALFIGATGFAVGYAAVELAVAHHQAERRFFRAGLLRVARALGLLIVALALVVTAEDPRAISLAFALSMVAIGFVASAPIAHLAHTIRTFRWSALAGEELWLSLYYVAAAGFAYVDVMVAGSMLSKHEVATLGATLRYVAIVLGAIPALGAILRVRTAQVDIVDSPKAQQAMVIGWVRRAALPTVFVLGLAAILAPHVIRLIDDGRYPDSVTAFQIFLVTALSAYVAAPVANVLMAQRRYSTLAWIYAGGLLVNLVGDIVVARPYGVVGIAVVSSAVYLAIDVALAATSIRHASKQTT